MSLISIEFVLFFLVLFPIYWAFKPFVKIQNLILLIASLLFVFYQNVLFGASVVIFSLFINLISYGFLSKSDFVRKSILACGVVGSLAALSFFKYVDFFRSSFSQLGFEYNLDILMPLGLSYYVFQSIAYLVSLYRTPYEALQTKRFNYLELLLHLSFFPTITSGPIIRAESFKSIDGMQQGALPQIRAVNREMIMPALAVGLILLGVIKKWWFAGVVADNIVKPVFDNPEQFDVFSVLMAIYGYSVQLFCDFSGYSDLVIGLAMLLGFQLPKNFNAPFLAVNIRDFWNRWHISLSTWIRDYIYIPLGGNKRPFLWVQINLIIAMTLSGVWHGSGWNFFLWGLLHGLGLVLLNIGDNLLKGREIISTKNIFLKILSIFFTFNFVCFTFVIFKTNSLEEAQLIFTSLFSGNMDFSTLTSYTLIFAGCIILGLVGYPLWIALFNESVEWLSTKSVLWWVLPISLVLFFIVIFAPSGIPGFIYANF